MNCNPQPLNPHGIRRLAETIPETPETVIQLHLLTQGTCRAYAIGDPATSDAVVVQSNSQPDEPFGIGNDPEGLWALLRHLDDWKVVDVSPTVAPRLGAIIREATGKRAWYYDDVYHTLTRPAPVIDDPVVREFTLDDMDLLKAAGVDGVDFRGGSPDPARGGNGRRRGGGRQNREHRPDICHYRRYADIGVATDEQLARTRDSPPRQHRSSPGGFRKPAGRQSGVAAKTTWRPCASHKNWDSRKSPA